MFDALADWDASVVEAFEALRWGPLTAVFLVASAWWVKDLVFAAIALAADLRAAPRTFPLAAATTAVVVPLAEGLAQALKAVFDRPRPERAGVDVDPLVDTPIGAAMPSGHALTAFAAAAVVSRFHPRLGLPLFALAALVALSRVYLGVHFLSDVLVGAAVGAALGFGAAELATRRLRPGPRTRDAPR